MARCNRALIVNFYCQQTLDKQYLGERLLILYTLHTTTYISPFQREGTKLGLNAVA